MDKKRQARLKAAVKKHADALEHYRQELEALEQAQTANLPSPSEIDVFYEKLGENVREARMAASIQQTTLGPMIGATRTSIINLEQGRQRMPVHRIMEICLVLGLNFGEFMGNVYDDWLKETDRENI